PYAPGDAELALEVAGAYQEIGMLYQYGYRERALHAFTNAALLIVGIAAGDPGMGPYRAQWNAVASLIRGLGGDVPAWVPPSVPHTEVTATVSDAPPPRRVPVAAPAVEEIPVSAPAPPAPANRAEFEEMRRLFAHASSRAAAAEDVMRQL